MRSESALKIQTLPPLRRVPSDHLGTLWLDCQTMLRATNTLRSLYSLPALAFDSRLGHAAWVQVMDCVTLGKLTHAGLDGSTVWDRAPRAGWPNESVQESAYWAGWPDADAREAVSAWAMSPGHWRNLVGRWTHLGAARVSDGRRGTFWVCCYGRLFDASDH